MWISRYRPAQVVQALTISQRVADPPVPTSSSTCAGGLTKMASQGPSKVRCSCFRKRSAGLFMSAVCSKCSSQEVAYSTVAVVIWSWRMSAAALAIPWMRS